MAHDSVVALLINLAALTQHSNLLSQSCVGESNNASLVLISQGLY